MFISIPTNSYRNQWACYILTDSDGKAFDAGVVKFTELLALPGLVMPDKHPVIYMTIIDHDTDRLKLANRAMSAMVKSGAGGLQWKILDAVKSWSKSSRRSGHPVMCVDTGEQWSSVTACAAGAGVSYSQLTNHLKGMVGHKTVKGKKYKIIV